MEPNPAQVVQDTLKTLIANTAKPAPLKESDIALLNFWLSQAIVEHNQCYSLEHYQEVEEIIGRTTAEWAKDSRERLRKWQVAKDKNLFGAQLDPNGRLTAKQEETVDNFLISQTTPTKPVKRFIVVGVQSSPNKGGHCTWKTVWLRSSQDWCGNSGYWHLTSVEDEAYTFDKYETALSAIKATGNNYLRVVPVSD